ncbi:hypothetical protein DL95DRAFT_452976 [Leptodontidium sp. 2 PMI_412]|nr:hypothetical protein DL95DRAFT_452976 [Leptodontidium sp. 2 PMI_412]
MPSNLKPHHIFLSFHRAALTKRAPDTGRSSCRGRATTTIETYWSTCAIAELTSDSSTAVIRSATTIGSYRTAFSERAAFDVGEDVVLEELVVVMEEIGFDVVDGEDVVLEELVVVVEEIGFDVVAEEVLEEETAVVERESELDKVDFEITLDVVEEIDVIERVREMDVVDRETILEVVTPTLLLD